MPHVYCLREPGIIALHAFSDSVIALSYFAIPVSLILLVRGRRDLAFRWAFVLFGVFILACGSTHMLGVITLWLPIYRVDGLVKLLTAAASLPTALLLIRLVPQAIALPGPEQLRRLNSELEERVRERTKDLERALSEKTVLLKEVHHRVKNNLAVVAGMLGMQAAAVDGERAATALADSEQRILSMALIHERLYSNENLDRLNFGEYAEQLATDLCASLAADPGRVWVEVDAEPLELSVDVALPCALILNELLTNALKYAYPAGEGGPIVVTFARREAGSLHLSCRDKGRGLPEDFSLDNSRSLGLRIVRILAKQIEGNLAVERRSPGTGFELTFRV
ncbi:MAG: sensor histidine kinase [Acidobacteriota bacterium]|nr:sensor histidine kinase [Acidobacteriota bacterium]